MDCKIDWYAFTVPLPHPLESGGDDAMMTVHNALDEVLLGAWTPIARVGRWKLEHGRGFYDYAVVDDESKIRMSWGHTNAHVYIEISGQACDHIRTGGLLYYFIEQTANRASRIDLAADFDCDIKPQDFIVNAQCPAYKGRGTIASVQGDTVYIGSRKGQRMLRVYRYHAPHPRSHLLRAEAEYKGEAAKAAAARLSELGEAELVQSALKPFGLQHPLYLSSVAQVSKIKSKPSDRPGIGTWRWLETQVKPAIITLGRDEREGIIAWLEALADEIEEAIPYMDTPSD